LLVVTAKPIHKACFAHILVQNGREREGFAFGTYFLEFGQFVTPLDQEAKLTPDGVDVVGFPLLHQVQQDVLVVTIYKPLGQEEAIQKDLYRKMSSRYLPVPCDRLALCQSSIQGQ
jgi:hypothetical protein